MKTASANDTAVLALLNQGDALAVDLRSALQACGADIVYEGSVGALDRDALKASGARIVLINLASSDDDDAIDEVQELLYADDYDIVINEISLTAKLNQNEQARWARQLTAKILGRPEIALPPPPPGARTIPSLAQHLADQVPVAEAPGLRLATSALLDVSAAPLVDAANSAAHVEDELQGADPQTPAEPVLVLESIESIAVDDGAAVQSDADMEGEPLEFIDIDVPLVTEPVAESVLDADEDDGFALTLERFEAASAQTAAPSDEGIEDLETLFKKSASVPAEIGIPDDDEILAKLEAHSGEAPAVTVTAKVPAPKVAETKAPAIAAPDWSLAPLGDGEEAAVAPAPAPKAADFGIETIPAHEYLAPKVDGPAGAEAGRVATDLAFLSSLELVPIEAEVPATPKNTVVYDTGSDLELRTAATAKPKPPASE